MTDLSAPDQDAYKQAVRMLYCVNDVNRSGGVPPDAVADYLDVSERTARRRLKRFEKRGELVRVRDVGGRSSGPNQTGYKPNSTITKQRS